jgi:hypothetical protein
LALREAEHQIRRSASHPPFPIKYAYRWCHFVDRHEFHGTTAAEIAEAHQADLAVQDRYGVKFLTYWFDVARGTAFCLVEAPDKETTHRVHA